MTCYCGTEFTNQNGVISNRSEARLTKHNTLCRYNVSRPSILSSTAPVGWHVSADLRSSSRCRTSEHTIENHIPGRLPVSAVSRSSHARMIAPSSGLPVLGQFGCSVPHHRPREDTRLNSSRNNSLIHLLEPTVLLSRSRPSIDQSIRPFNRPIYPTVQSTNLSHRCNQKCRVPIP